MLKDNILFIAIFFLFTPFSWGQDPFYYKIDKSKGLPSNNVYDVFEDSKGFMWFTTDEGICKFDGKNYVSYSSPIQTSKSGSNIKEDRFGRIWYTNFDGYLYYVADGSLKALNNNNTIGFVKFGIMDDYLLLIQKKSIVIYDLKSLKITKKIPLNTDYLLATHNKNNFFYILCENLIIIDKNLHLKKISLPKELAYNFPAPIIDNTDNGLVFFSKYTQHYYTLTDTIFKKNKHNIGFVQNLWYDNKANWICTPQGAIKFTNNYIDTKKTYLKNFNVSTLYKDSQQNYWFCTIGNGIILVPDITNKYVLFDKNPNVISTCNNTIYIGTKNNTIYKTDLSFKKFYKIYSGNTNHSIYNIWTDSTLGKIFFQSDSFTVININEKKESKSLLSVKDIKKIDATYYGFAASGLYGFFKTSNIPSDWDSFVYKNTWQKKDLKDMYLLKNDCRAKSTAYNPNNGTIYFATNNGLFLVSKNKNTELQLNNKSIYFSKIQTHQNSVYGLTTNNKIYAIDCNNKILFSNFNNAINNEKITNIKIIKSNLYLFTPYSIYSYNLLTKKTNKIIALTSAFEVTDLEQDKDTIILVTTNGFIILNQRQSKNYSAPKFIVNQITINGKKQEIYPLTNLKFNENNIAINFSVLCFVPDQRNKLYYKINNDNWQLLEENSQNLKLNALSPGKYFVSFQTKFENKKSAITTLKIVIKPPFWFSIGFIFLIISIFLILVLSVYKWQIKKIKKHNYLLLEKINLEKNINQAKLKAIQSQMNPHFFYNALNTLQSYILSNEKKEAIDYLSKFSTLTRKILEMTERDWISIPEEVNVLKLYLDVEKGRFEDNFKYKIIIDPLIDDELIKIPPMLLQPYVENALKHGLFHKLGQKTIEISFKKNKNFLKIKIKDNGIGRKKSLELNYLKNKKHQSFASNALANRIDLLNKNNLHKIKLNIIDNYDHLGQALGTTVIIQIAIKI